MSSGKPIYRRPRTSNGPLDVGSMEASSSSLAQPMIDVDFRKRHSKQNKEIIGENVKNKLALRAFQDEVAMLQNELLEVTQANRVLQGRMRRMQEESTTLRDQATLEAIEAILASIPALQELRSSLTSLTSPMPQPKDTVSRINTLRQMGLTIATRPAAFGARLNVLGSLNEGSEWAEVQEPLLSARKIHRGRHSGTGSKAASRSPLPLAIRKLQATPPAPLHDSPSSSSSSPTPQRKHSSPRDTERKARRRRQSGLMLHQLTDLEEPANSPDTVHATTTPVKDPVVVSTDASTWDGNTVMDLTNAGNDALLETTVEEPEVVSKGKGRGKGRSRQSVSTTIPETNVRAFAEGQVQEMPSPRAGEELPSLAPISGRSRSSALSPAPSDLTILSDSLVIEDDGGRGRRARKSVSYKEPSLHKKMRKPDGTSVEDAMKYGRPSLPLLPIDALVPPTNLGLGGTRRKSVLSLRRPMGSGNANAAGDDGGDEDEEDERGIDQFLLPITGEEIHEAPSSELSDPPSSSSSSSAASSDTSEHSAAPVSVPVPVRVTRPLTHTTTAKSAPRRSVIPAQKARTALAIIPDDNTFAAPTTASRAKAGAGQSQGVAKARHTAGTISSMKRMEDTAVLGARGHKVGSRAS